MEEYVDYLKGKIQECELEDMHVSVSVYKEVNTYLSFLDAAKLKSLHNKVGIVTAGSRQFKSCQVCRALWYDETCSSHHGGQQRDA
jgi:hypothetical protein